MRKVEIHNAKLIHGAGTVFASKDNDVIILPGRTFDIESLEFGAAGERELSHGIVVVLGSDADVNLAIRSLKLIIRHLKKK